MTTLLTYHTKESLFPDAANAITQTRGEGPFKQTVENGGTDNLKNLECIISRVVYHVIKAIQ